jgi:hypothetical protein
MGRPEKNYKSHDTDSKPQKKEVMSMVKEGIEHFLKNKKQKTEKVYAIEKKKEPDSDFEIDEFFKDIDVSSESNNDE